MALNALKVISGVQLSPPPAGGGVCLFQHTLAGRRSPLAPRLCGKFSCLAVRRKDRYPAFQARSDHRDPF